MDEWISYTIKATMILKIHLAFSEAFRQVTGKPTQINENFFLFNLQQKILKSIFIK